MGTARPTRQPFRFELGEPRVGIRTWTAHIGGEADGFEEAGPGREAKHPEGSESGEGQKDHHEAPKGDPPGPRQAGRESEAARRQARPGSRGSNEGADLRGGKEKRDSGPLQDGEMGPDRGHTPELSPPGVSSAQLG